jgi:4-amino-4-deoxy-L-arabinose transferase-like glycosyltransferase
MMGAFMWTMQYATLCGHTRILRLTLALILLLAFFLRVAALEQVPPGPRLDEVLVFMETDRIHAGSLALFSADIFEETLFHYLLTGAVDGLGKRLIVGRWLAGVFGLLAIAALYPLAQRAFGRRVAVLAVALIAVGLWPVLYSRFAIRITSLLPCVTASVYLFWRGVERPSGQDKSAWRDLALAGVSMGVGVYTYGVGRYAPAVLGAFALYLLVANRALLQKRLAPIMLAAVIAVGMDAPLLLYLQSFPGVDQRFGQVSAPLVELLEGNPARVLDQAWRTAVMAIWQGDQEWLYNLSRRPVFDPVTGALFYLGLAVCVMQWRQHWRGAMLAWLAIGMGQAVFTWPAASFSHTVTAQPVFYILPALGASWLFDKLEYYVKRKTYCVLRITYYVACCLLLVILNLGLTVRDYFGGWAVQPSVRAEYQASLTNLARYLESHALPPVVAGGALVDVWNPMNAYGFGLIYRQPERPVAWFNPVGALAWPPDSSVMTVALPRVDRTIPGFAPELSQRFLGDIQLVYDEKLPDGQRVFKLYQARGRRALDERLKLLGTQSVTVTQAMSLPVNLANRLDLLGYEISANTLGPGQAFYVITYWETRQAFMDSLVAFTHLLGPDGKLYAQADRLDVFTDSLYPGAAFAQLHRLTVPPDAPPGRYQIQVGMYNANTLNRLPFMINGQSVESVELSGVRVNGQ